MYKIVFKGRDVEPLLVEDTNGQKIWDIWLTTKNPQKIVVQNQAFVTSDIKSINKIEKTAAELAPVRGDTEYIDFRKKMLALPLEKRASILRFAKMIWTSHKPSEMPELVKEQIKAAQLEYFKENPNCIYANPKVYRHLIAPHVARRSKNSMQHISNSIPETCLKIIEAAISTDLQYSRS